MTTDRSAVVRSDLLVATALVGAAVLVAVSAVALDLWWVGVLTATVTAGLAGASDRSTAGRWLAAGVGGVAILAFLWSTWSSAVPVGAVPWVNAGLGVGIAANRLVFGVVRPVPQSRVARQREGGV